MNKHKVKHHRNSDTKKGNRQPQENYLLGTVSNELLKSMRLERLDRETIGII